MKELDVADDKNTVKLGSMGDADNLRTKGRGVADKTSIRMANVQMDESQHVDSSRNTEEGAAAAQAMKDFIPGDAPLRVEHYSWGLYNRDISDVNRVINGVEVNMQLVAADQGLTDYNTKYGTHPNPDMHNQLAPFANKNAPFQFGMDYEPLSQEEMEYVQQQQENFTETHNAFQEGKATQQQLDDAMVNLYGGEMSGMVARYRQMLFNGWGNKADRKFDHTMRSSIERATRSNKHKRAWNIGAANQHVVNPARGRRYEDPGFWGTLGTAFDKFHMFNAMGEVHQMQTARAMGKDWGLDENALVAGVPTHLHAALKQEMASFNDESAWVMREQMLQDIENDRIYNNLPWYAQIGYAVPSYLLDPMTIAPGMVLGKVAAGVAQTTRKWRAGSALARTKRQAVLFGTYASLGVGEGLISNAPQLMQDHTYTIRDWYFDGLTDGAFGAGLGLLGENVARPLMRAKKYKKTLHQRRMREIAEMQEHVQKEMESRGQTPKKVRTPMEQKVFNQKMKAYLKAKHGGVQGAKTRSKFGQWIHEIENPNQRKTLAPEFTFSTKQARYKETINTLGKDISELKERRETVANKLGIQQRTHNRRPDQHVKDRQRELNKSEKPEVIKELQESYQTLNKTIENLEEELQVNRNDYAQLLRTHRASNKKAPFATAAELSRVSAEGFRSAVDTIKSVFPKMKGNHPIVRLMNAQKGMNARVTFRSMTPAKVQEMQRLKADTGGLRSAKVRLAELEKEWEQNQAYNAETRKRLKVVQEINADILRLAMAFPDGNIDKGTKAAIEAISNAQRKYLTVNVMDMVTSGVVDAKILADYATMLRNLDIWGEGAKDIPPMESSEFVANFSGFLNNEKSVDSDHPDFDRQLLTMQQEYNSVTSQIKDIIQMNENVNANGTDQAVEAMEKINGLFAKRMEQLELAGRPKYAETKVKPNLFNYNVKQLKNIARKIKKDYPDMRISGNKADLVLRIRKHFDSIEELDENPLTPDKLKEIMEKYDLTQREAVHIFAEENEELFPNAPKYKDSTKRYESSMPISIDEAMALLDAKGIKPMTDEYNDILHDLISGERTKLSDEIRNEGRADPIYGRDNTERAASEVDLDLEKRLEKEGAADYTDADGFDDPMDYEEPDEVSEKGNFTSKEVIDQTPLPRSYTQIRNTDLYSRDKQGGLSLENLTVLRDRIRGSLLKRIRAHDLNVKRETRKQRAAKEATKRALLKDKNKVIKRMIKSRSMNSLDLVMSAMAEIRNEQRIKDAMEETEIGKLQNFRDERIEKILTDVENEYLPRIETAEDSIIKYDQQIKDLEDTAVAAQITQAEARRDAAKRTMDEEFPKGTESYEYVEANQKHYEAMLEIQRLKNTHEPKSDSEILQLEEAKYKTEQSLQQHYDDMQAELENRMADPDVYPISKELEDVSVAEQQRRNTITLEVEDQLQPRIDKLEEQKQVPEQRIAEQDVKTEHIEERRVLERQVDSLKKTVKEIKDEAPWKRAIQGPKQGPVVVEDVSPIDKQYIADRTRTMEEAEAKLVEVEAKLKAHKEKYPSDVSARNSASIDRAVQQKKITELNDQIAAIRKEGEEIIQERIDDPTYDPIEIRMEQIERARQDMEKHRDAASDDGNQNADTKGAKEEPKEKPKADSKPKPKPKNIVAEDLDDIVDGEDSGTKTLEEKEDVNKQANAAYEKQVEEATDAVEEFTTEFVDSGEQKIMEFAQRTMSNATDWVGRKLSAWTKDLATKLMESKLVSAQALGFNVTEVGRGFAGRIRRKASGSLKRDKVYKELAGRVHPAYVHTLNAYASEKGKTAFGKMNAQQMSGEQMELVQRFNEEVFSVQELRRQGKPIPDSISPLTVKYMDDVDGMFDWAHNRLVEAGIDGFHKNNKVKHYIPHVWQRGKLQKIIGQRGRQFVEDLFTKAYLEAPAMGQKAYDQKGARAAAERQIKWIMEQDGSNSYEDQHLPITDSRSRHRRDLNTLAEIDGVKIMDILDTDLISVLDKYSHRVAGWTGLAESTNGVLSSDLKIHTYKEHMIQEGKDKGVKTRDLEQWYDDLIDQMFGRPTRTFFADTFLDRMATKFLTGKEGKAVHKGLPNELRQLKDSTALALMGGLGTAQLIETGQVMTRGMLNTFSDPKVIKLMFQMAGEDLDSPGVMQQIEEMSSIKNNIEWWDRQSVHLDQQQLDEVGAVRAASLRIADALTFGKYKAPASRLLGKTTGYNLIKKYQTRLVQASFALDVAKHFRDGTGKMTNARLADLGLTDINGVDVDLQKVFNDFVEVDPKTGAIIDLHPEKWSKEASEKFQLAMLRDEAQQVQRTHIGELPTWMNRPLMALLFQFRQMPIVAQNKQLARSMAFADKEAVLAVMLNAAMAGTVRYAKFAAVGGAVAAITGEEWVEPYAGPDGVDGSKWAGDAAKYITQFGMFADAYDLVLGENQPEVKDWRDAGSRVLGTIPSLGVAKEYSDMAEAAIDGNAREFIDSAHGATALGNTAYGDAMFTGIDEMVQGWGSPIPGGMLGAGAVAQMGMEMAGITNDGVESFMNNLGDREGTKAHASIEGGKATAAYGVKFTNGLTKTAGETDKHFAKRVAMSHEEDVIEKLDKHIRKGVDKKFGKGASDNSGIDAERMWKELDAGTRAAVIDLAFNAGKGSVGSGLLTAIAEGKGKEAILKQTLDTASMTTKAGAKVTLPSLAKRRAIMWNESGATKIDKVELTDSATKDTKVVYKDKAGNELFSYTTSKPLVKLDKNGKATNITSKTYTL